MSEQAIDLLKLISQTLIFIADTIETCDNSGNIDIDCNDAILNIKTNKGTFVINRHSATMQIWLASPISGPYHFSYINKIWQSPTGSALLQILTSELQIDFMQKDNVI